MWQCTKERIRVFYPENTKSWVNLQNLKSSALTGGFHDQKNLIRKHLQTWCGYLIVAPKLGCRAKSEESTSENTDVFGNPSKEGYCFKLTKGLPEKMVANCLKLQTNKGLAEGKEGGQHKQRGKKVWRHQSNRPMGPSNQKQDLELRITEVRDKIRQLCLAQEPNHGTMVDCSRGKEVKPTHQDPNSGSESRIEQDSRRKFKEILLLLVGSQEQVPTVMSQQEINQKKMNTG